MWLFNTPQHKKIILKNHFPWNVQLIHFPPNNFLSCLLLFLLLLLLLLPQDRPTRSLWSRSRRMTWTPPVLLWISRHTTVPTRPCTCAGTATPVCLCLITVWLWRYSSSALIETHKHTHLHTHTHLMPWINKNRPQAMEMTSITLLSSAVVQRSSQPFTFSL